MTDQEPLFTATERHLIERSFDLQIVRRRVVLSLVTALLLGVVLVAAALYLDWPQPLIFAFLVYIAFTTYERWAYGQAVLLYKSVVSKLWSRVDRDGLL